MNPKKSKKTQSIQVLFFLNKNIQFTLFSLQDRNVDLNEWKNVYNFTAKIYSKKVTSSMKILLTLQDNLVLISFCILHCRKVSVRFCFTGLTIITTLFVPLQLQYTMPLFHETSSLCLTREHIILPRPNTSKIAY